MSELRLPPNAGHLRGNEVVATILDLVTPAAHPHAPAVRGRQSRAARRCIDRNVRDLPDRIEVAQALGLLPYVAHSRRADRTSGPRVERRPS